MLYLASSSNARNQNFLEQSLTVGSGWEIHKMRLEQLAKLQSITEVFIKKILLTANPSKGSRNQPQELPMARARKA